MPQVIQQLAPRSMADLTRLPVRIHADLMPSDRAIRDVAHDVLNAFKLSFAVAAAEIPVSKPGPVDTMFQEFMASRSQQARSAHRARASSILQASPALRAQTFGRFGQVDPKTYATAGALGLQSLVPARPTVDSQRLQAGIERVRNGAVITPDKPEPTKAGKFKLVPSEGMKQLVEDHTEGAKYKKLGLFVKEVHCVEETDEVGSDQIYLGGAVTSADGKATRMIEPFKVSEDFDEGERVMYPPFNPHENFQDLMNKPGRKLAEWDIRTDLGWPTAYAAVLTMAEKDDGGFWKFLQNLIKGIIEAVEKELKMGLGAAAGAGIGAAIGGLWGAIVGAAVGFIVGALLDWITGDNPDDIVATVPLVMSFGASTLSYYQWTGLLKEPRPPVFPIDCRGDGGRYTLYCYYRVYT